MIWKWKYVLCGSIKVLSLIRTALYLSSTQFFCGIFLHDFMCSAFINPLFNTSFGVLLPWLWLVSLRMANIVSSEIVLSAVCVGYSLLVCVPGLVIGNTLWAQRSWPSFCRQSRDVRDPRTPDKFKKHSRRAWDGSVRTWKLRIYRRLEDWHWEEPFIAPIIIFMVF